MGPLTRTLRASGRRRASGIVLATSLMLTACAAQDTGTSTAEPEPAPAPAVVVDPVVVVATTSILGDIVANLVGDDGVVTVLMGPGVDPHSYQASAADAAALRDADLVVANGLLLEEGLLAALDGAAADGARVFTVADKLDPIAFGGDDHDDHDDHDHDDKHDDHDHDHDDKHHDHGDDDHDDHDDHDHDHDHGDEDPHFWWDPIRTALAVELITAELAAARPDIDWTVRSEQYRTQLLEVHDELVATFDAIPQERRRIITNHDSLGYLEVRYGVEVIGTVIPGSSTTVEANPRAFSELIDLLVEEGITVVFAENTDSTTLAERLATDAGGRGQLDVTVVRIPTDALGPAGSGAETYLGMLRTTAALIGAALTA
jgi:zinc/manganese transport system substrate-binding protein